MDSEAYLELIRTSTMKLFAKIINGYSRKKAPPQISCATPSFCGVGCSFYIKTKLKSEIFNDKKSL